MSRRGQNACTSYLVDRLHKVSEVVVRDGVVGVSVQCGPEGFLLVGVSADVSLREKKNEKSRAYETEKPELEQHQL